MDRAKPTEEAVVDAMEDHVYENDAMTDAGNSQILPGLIHLQSIGNVPRTAEDITNSGPNSNVVATEDAHTVDRVADLDLSMNSTANGNQASNEFSKDIQESEDDVADDESDESVTKDLALPNEANSDYESDGEPGVEYDSDPYVSDGNEHIEALDASINDDQSEEEEDYEVIEVDESEIVAFKDMITSQIIEEEMPIERNDTKQNSRSKKQAKQVDQDDLDPEEAGFHGLHYKTEIPDINLDPETPLLKLGNVVGIVPPERPKTHRNLVPTKSVDNEEVSNTNGSTSDMVIVTIHKEDDEEGTYGETALDSGTIVFIEDKRVVGVIADTIGPVRDPFYLVAFKNWNLIEDFGIKLGSPIFFDEKHNKTVQIAGLTRRKTGKDEVGEMENGNYGLFYDEPADDGDFDDSDIASTPPFSSDEKEAKYKEQRDAKRQNKRAKKKGSRGQRREGRYSGHMGFQPGKRRVEDFAEDGEIEEGYTRLQRPGNLNYESSNLNRGFGGRGRGGRARGDRQFQQGRSGHDFAGRQQYNPADAQRFHSSQSQVNRGQPNLASAPPFMMSPSFPPGAAPPVSFPGVPADAQKLVDQMLENLVKERVQDQVNAVLQSLGVAGTSNVPLTNISTSNTPSFHLPQGTGNSVLPGLGNQQYGQQGSQPTNYNLGSQPPLYQRSNSYGDQSNANPETYTQQGSSQHDSNSGNHSLNQQNSSNYPYGRR